MNVFSQVVSHIAGKSGSPAVSRDFVHLPSTTYGPDIKEQYRSQKLVDEDYERVNTDFDNVEKTCVKFAALHRIQHGRWPLTIRVTTRTYTKRTHMRQPRRMILIGLMQMLCFCVTQAFAQTNIQPTSRQSESKTMADTPVARQIEAVLDLVDKGMAILRDDRAMDFSDPAFGEPHSINGGIKDQGKEYVYRTEKLPGVDIVFATVADPFDYSDDRAKVAVVPRFFELNFISSSVRIDINPSLIKQRLSLSDYWVDSGGARNPGNDLGAGIPPTPLLHAYRYRASETADSRFPVNVELAYGDADPNDQTTRRLLMAITISRDYPYLTPEMRRQKREEQKALPWHALPERSDDQ